MVVGELPVVVGVGPAPGDGASKVAAVPVGEVLRAPMGRSSVAPLGARGAGPPSAVHGLFVAGAVLARSKEAPEAGLPSAIVVVASPTV